MNREMEHKASFKTRQEVMQLQPIQIWWGIFQGDSPSPLLFCRALFALTHELNRDDFGYQVHNTEREISHLLYMNDLKLLVRDEDELENEIKIVTAIGKELNMHLVLKNCANIW